MLAVVSSGQVSYEQTEECSPTLEDQRFLVTETTLKSQIIQRYECSARCARPKFKHKPGFG